jgi:hypothetical protein
MAETACGGWGATRRDTGRKNAPVGVVQRDSLAAERRGIRQ